MKDSRETGKRERQREKKRKRGRFWRGGKEIESRWLWMAAIRDSLWLMIEYNTVFIKLISLQLACTAAL